MPRQRLSFDSPPPNLSFGLPTQSQEPQRPARRSFAEIEAEQSALLDKYETEQGTGESIWENANRPRWTQPAKWGEALGEFVESAPVTSPMSLVRNKVAGAASRLAGNTVSQATSPVGALTVGATLASGGATAPLLGARGAAGAAMPVLAGRVAQGVGVLQAGHGLGEVGSGVQNRDLGQVGRGVVEVGFGALGMRNPGGKPRPSATSNVGTVGQGQVSRSGFGTTTTIDAADLDIIPQGRGIGGPELAGTPPTLTTVPRTIPMQGQTSRVPPRGRMLPENAATPPPLPQSQLPGPPRFRAGPAGVEHLPEAPLQGVVEKGSVVTPFSRGPASAGMGGPRSAEKEAFEALVPDRYKTTPQNVSDEGLTYNWRGETVEPPAPGLRLNPQGQLRPEKGFSMSFPQMVDKYGLEEAAARARVTEAEAQKLLKGKPITPAAKPKAKSKYPPPTQTGKAPKKVEATPPEVIAAAKKLQAMTQREAAPVATAAPVKGPNLGAMKTAELQALAAEGNTQAADILAKRAASPRQPTSLKERLANAIPERLKSETGAVGPGVGRITETKAALDDIDRQIATAVKSGEPTEGLLADREDAYNAWQSARGVNPAAEVPRNALQKAAERSPEDLGEPLPRMPTADSLNPEFDARRQAMIDDTARMERERLERPFNQAEQDRVDDWNRTTDRSALYEGRNVNDIHTPLDERQLQVKAANDKMRQFSDERARWFSEQEEQLPEGEFFEPPPGRTKEDFNREYGRMQDERNALVERLYPEETRALKSRPPDIDVGPIPTRPSSDDPRWLESRQHSSGVDAMLREDAGPNWERPPFRNVEDKPPFINTGEGSTIEPGRLVPNKDWYAGQDRIDRGQVESVKEFGVSAPEAAARSKPYVTIDSEGNYQIHDGHHRSTAALEKGEALDMNIEDYSPRDSWFRQTRNMTGYDSPFREAGQKAASKFSAAMDAAESAEKGESQYDALIRSLASMRRRFGNETGAVGRNINPIIKEQARIKAARAQAAAGGANRGRVPGGGNPPSPRPGASPPPGGQPPSVGAGAVPNKPAGIGEKAWNAMLQARMTAMLSGLAIPKSMLGNVGAHAFASMERKSMKPLQELFNTGENWKNLKEGWRTGAVTPDANDLGFGKLNVPGRIMGAFDEMSTKSLQRAGMTEAEAKEILLTSPTTFGKSLGLQTPIGKLLVPFQKTPANTMKQGFERAWKHKGIGAGAIAAGAGMGTQTDDPKKIALASALMGPYAIPFLLGALPTAGEKAVQGFSPIPEWSVHKSITDPFAPFQKPGFARLFEKKGGDASLWGKEGDTRIWEKKSPAGRARPKSANRRSRRD
jgi:hypothetical protein